MDQVHEEVHGFGSFPTVPYFADTCILENHQMLVLDSSNSDFGGKWKVRQKLKLAI